MSTETTGPSADSIRELRELGAALVEGNVESYDIDDAPDVIAALVPVGYQLQRLAPDPVIESRRSKPRRVRGTATVTDTLSWLAYFGKHGDDDSEVFGDVAAGTITGVLNAPSGQDDPAWGDHRVVLKLEQSPAWKLWTEADGKMFDQTAFAELIEARLPDLVTPTGADALEIAQSLKATKGVNFESGSQLHSGQRRFTYAETIEAKAGQRGQLEVPTELELQVQVWRGVGIVVPLTARFRYRPTSAGLTLGVVLDRVDDVLDAAWRSLLGELTETLTVPVLAGQAPDYTR